MSTPAQPLGRVLLDALTNLVVEPEVPGWTGRIALAPAPARPAVGVVGLVPRCGATTVARALAVELALRDLGRTAVVGSGDVGEGGAMIGTQASSQLARSLSAANALPARATGRICVTATEQAGYSALVRAAADLAPLVIDVADPSQAAVVASLVDAVVLVAAPRTEPALGHALAASLGRVGPDPLVVLNADRGGEGAWDGRCALSLPRSRLGARLAAAGREPRGPFGRAVVRLADLIEDCRVSGGRPSVPEPDRGERGQALLLLLGVVAAVLVGALVLVAFGQAIGGKSRHQRAADLSAVSAAGRMKEDYPRLFEPPVLPNGVPNPRHLPLPVYLARAQAAAVQGAAHNGVRIGLGDVTFPGMSFAPTRVRVRTRGTVEVRLDRGDRRRRVAVSAAATAELTPALGGVLGMPGMASGGGYNGPLAYRMGKPMRPDVAGAFDRMAAAAHSEAGLALSVNSAFRSDEEQARLFAANPNPKWVAPPGTSLHRYGTELDLGPDAAYAWLKANAGRFGFIHRYAWEPWHYGFGANPRDVPAQYERGSWEPPGGDHGRIHHGLPSFVPDRFHDPIARAALRWNVPMNVLAAQLYAESNFNPFAQSPAGAQGIAQFMPGTARSYGLSNPYDPVAAIDAQAHLMSDLLKQFDGDVSLALAGYNAGPGAVTSHGGIPPYAETRNYVARILGLLDGAGELAGTAFEVRLIE